MNRKELRAAVQGEPMRGNRVDTATAAAPVDAAGLVNAGLKHLQTGRLAEAEACFRRALALEPDRPDALHLLGVVAHQAGRHDAAVSLIRRAIQRSPHPGYFLSLGNVLQSHGQPEEAIAAYAQAIRIRPDYAEAHCNLANALKEQGRLDEAVAAYTQAIRIKPDFAEAHSNLGIAMNQQGKCEQAIAAFRQAIRVKPDLAEAHCNLGAALNERRKSEEAVAELRQAIRIKPDYAEAHSNLGDALKEQGKLEEAAAACRQAIRIRPEHGEAHSNLGLVLKEQGKIEEALAAFSHAIRIRADLAGAFSNLLFALNYEDRWPPDRVFGAHREWDERYGTRLAQPAAYANDRDPGRRLRIGYVSPDFRRHSVAYFLEPLLRGHDHEAVEVFCYAEVAEPDAVTQHLRGFADHWLVTVGMRDDALAQRMRADIIDILVDLAGHTAKNRLRVFGRKPAPVQVTWLGYPNTTGLGSIDYRLVDAVTDPEGVSDGLATETLVRLPGGFLCYAPLIEAPAPSPPPSSTTRVVTFGSFNNPAKTSAATLDAWAALLGRLPASRLVLKGLPFADAATCASFLARLGERDVAAERVELMPWQPGAAAHLSAYHRLDIALDPFPYNGTTTTCEALWMGVPVVTRMGERHAGRVGASLLTQIGATDLIARSAEEYVDIALALANDPARLSALRRSLRPRMAASSLCDAHAFARKIEAAYRSMWQKWCKRSTQ
jgi:predicted O-linked N-acetylglucosamine transferase (SPINDLY family)